MFSRADAPAACPIGDGERINLFRALAIWRTGRQGRPRSHLFADEEVLPCAMLGVSRAAPSRYIGWDGSAVSMRAGKRRTSSRANGFNRRKNSSARTTLKPV